jgi:hypothetical protein
MAQAQKAFEWVSIIDQKIIREAIVALQKTNVGDENDWVYKDLYFFKYHSAHS